MWLYLRDHFLHANHHKLRVLYLVFDIAFMFLAFGGIISIQDVDVTSRAEIMGALTTMSIFILLMSLGVWHVFRKRGRIYI